MKKVLVIEDEKELLDGVKDLLTISGYECAGARNGKEGVKMAKMFSPDLIVSDVIMPQLDGYGVLAMLRDEPETALIPFIFLTGQNEKKDLRRGMSLGADDYLLKPFSPDELLTAVSLRLEKQEKLLHAAAGKNQELKNYLSTTLPHELRTPLTGIMGYLDMLQTDYFSPDEVQNMVEHMSDAADRLYRLVENHILFSQLMLTKQDQGKIDQLRQFAQCDYPVQSIKLAAQKQAAVHDRMRDLVIHELAEATLQLFPDNLEKIVEELVDNAFKFSPAGTPVTIHTSCSHAIYEISVSDAGRGMSPAQIAAVGVNQQFNRAQFEQQGVGLGLTLTEQLCKVFGGNFRLATNSNDGITVTAALPLTEDKD